MVKPWQRQQKNAYEFAFKTARFPPVQNEKVKKFPWYKMLI